MKNNALKIVLMDEAISFIKNLPQKARRKIYYNLDRVANGERDSELFKKLEGTDIWEFRTLFNGVSYRLFAFWDTTIQAMVIATHGIIKKSQRTPIGEIAKADKIRKEYFTK